MTSADFGALVRRVEADGQVQGRATVTGIWSAGQLRVEQQTAPGLADGDASLLGDASVPGTAGWLADCDAPRRCGAGL